MGHIRAYTNPRTVLDPFGFRQFYLKRPGERLVLAGEVNHQFEVVIVHINGLHKIPYDSLLEFLVPVILGAEHEQVFYDVIASNEYVRLALKGMQCGATALLVNVAIDLLKKQLTAKLILPIVIIIGTFIANLFFDVNIMLLVLIDGIIGLIFMRSKIYG